MTKPTIGDQTQTQIDMLAEAFAKQFVRKDNKFFDVDYLGNALSRTDVEQMMMNQIIDDHSDVQLSNPLLKGLYGKLIEAHHSDRSRAIQVWNGHSVCLPGNSERLVPARGAVTANVWVQPAYRDLRVNAFDADAIDEFLNYVFQTEAERDLFVNWLAYCLQNESEKPSWAPFFYSASKGTGKSTLCRMMTELFGEHNTAVQNNVDKLTQQFNATLLRSKLVICEETHLQQGSSKGNTIKTYITDPFILVEQKGKEQVRARNITCFAFTSNFLPDWMEPGERRYAVFDVDHDGRAGGPDADAFAELVGRVHAFLDDPSNVARFYNALMSRELPTTFNAKSLNITDQATPIMKRLQETSRQTNLDQLEEYLNADQLVVVPQETVATYVRKELNGNGNQTRHLMNELRWTKSTVKWGGKDYARSIWARPGYAVDGGKIYGTEHEGTPIAEYLVSKGAFEEIEIIR
ncbi:primase-helicase family protein [Sulfitobacter mediterraneus]|uniref:primase-helicase family protein n=1 Tax=Sulfitobacter mediterraneus TaxID=83219 RepID=UPI000EA30495|nr:primase-helicase family protein [Sulfitobacter mediterraneus]